ncbi:MAG TPA: DMT family transporter [Candidatus Binataceae bacterium]|jgi:O-acetylserine/cysteine efflux transporter|nr:DMT family transporter [Candidatus Binataceae bacterium]
MTNADANSVTPPIAARSRHEPDRGAQFRIGVVSAVATTIIAAVQPVITRYGAQSVDPLAFCAGSMTVAAAILAIIMWWRGEIEALLTPRWIARLVALSMTGSVATSLTLVFGLRRIDAIAGVILLQSEPLYSLLLSTIFLGERPAKRQLIATAVILVGIGSVFAMGRAFSPVWAAALLFVTPLFWQISHVISLGVMPPLSETCVTGARTIFAALVLDAILLAVDAPAVVSLAQPRTLAVICVTGGFVYVLGSLTWYGAINRLSLAWTTALTIPGVPMLSFLFAIIFLGERPSVREFCGMLVAVGGVLFLVLGAGARRQHRDAELAEAVHRPLT